MYNVPRYKVQLVKESSTSIACASFSNPAEVAAFLAPEMACMDREQFMVLLLNTKNRIIGTNVVSIGSLNASIVHPREVFRPAILAPCAAVILAHNHPSGDPSPSMEDMELTKRLDEAGKILGIKVLDHVVIGETSYFSFKEKGLMQA